MSYSQVFRNIEIASSYIDEAKEQYQQILADRQAGLLPVLNLAYQPEKLAEFAPVASFFTKFDTIVVLGTGGSSLGGQSLVALKQDLYGFSRQGPRVIFLDNIDPQTFESFYQRIVFEKTGFIVISKSGNTAETLCQLASILTSWKAQKILADPSEHFLVITEPKKSQLRTLAKELEIEILDHDPYIGGRFAALSLVGLLPAQIAGLDVSQVLEGAKSVLEEGENNSAITGAAWTIQNHRNGQGLSVMMPYIDRLYIFCKWYRQLWAESLGKEGKGITPIAAYGTVDQHSQLQLYLDGPKDKMFTVMTTEQRGRGIVIEDICEEFHGKTMGDLMQAEQYATIETLVRQGCPTRVFELTSVDEYSIGALIMHYMLETMLTARMLGVNAFDQPAVEEGKILAKQYLEKGIAA